MKEAGFIWRIDGRSETLSMESLEGQLMKVLKGYSDQ
jgi:hypothetical protein